MSHSNEKTEMTLYLHKDVEKAWLVSQNKKEIDAKWLPKSQCEVVERREGKHPIEMNIIVPDWLLVEKGFL